MPTLQDAELQGIMEEKRGGSWAITRLKTQHFGRITRLKTHTVFPKWNNAP
jgi:hypothetical protein